jgi:proteasome lid subunit RPN8/RPN11
MEFSPPVSRKGRGGYTLSIAVLAAMLRISQSGLETLRRFARQAYPEECCGVLLGRAEANANRVLLVAPVANIADSGRDSRYQIAPEELIRLQRTAREQGLSIVGFYHSHPEHAAQWSQSDLEQAYWTSCSYVIISVHAQDGHVTVQNTRSFRLTGSDAQKEFVEEEIVQDAD